MSFWEGIVSGFGESREANILREQEMDKARRASESKVFEHLLQSNDPEMRALAMTGLLESAQPGKRSGFQGYLGKVQSGQIYPQVLARMNEMIPDENVAAPQPGGGPAPPRPGSASMSANAPVEPGSAPIQLPGQPLPAEAAPPGAEEVGAPPPMLGAEGAPMLGGPPPVSKWKRRGTGVPTAEEIAEINATAPIRARIKMVTEELTRRGASPEDIQRAILGIAGAPTNQRNLTAVSGWGVRLVKDGPVLPVLLDQTGKGYTLSDGTPVPRTAEMVRMAGGTSSGGLTSTIRDSPEIRDQYGIDPADVTPSGYWKIKELASGGFQIMPSEYTPPPFGSGTVEIAEPGTGVPVRAVVPRGGGQPVPVGDAPGTVPAKAQTDAQALKEAIDRVISDTRIPGLPLNPARRDQVTQQEAQKMGLPYRTYNEVVQAMRSTPEVTPRQRTEGQESMADRIERRLREGGGREMTPPPAPPPLPPIRGRGAGPRQ